MPGGTGSPKTVFSRFVCTKLERSLPTGSLSRTGLERISRPPVSNLATPKFSVTGSLHLINPFGNTGLKLGTMLTER